MPPGGRGSRGQSELLAGRWQVGPRPGIGCYEVNSGQLSRNTHPPGQSTWWVLGPSVILGLVILPTCMTGGGTPLAVGHETGLGGQCVAQPVSSTGPWGKLVLSRRHVPRPGLLAGGPPGLAPRRPQRLTTRALLGARGCPRLQPASHSAAPAASCHAHAALAPLFTVRLALRPLMP